MTGDPRFFGHAGPHTLGVIAQATGATPHDGQSRMDRFFQGVAPLQTATAAQVSFLDNPRYADLLEATQAGAVILQPAVSGRLPDGCIGLLSANPYLAWARVCMLFHPAPATRPGRHRTAWIDPDASVDASAQIGPHASIGAGADIGPGCRIDAGVVIGEGVVLGADCAIGAGASVSHAILGARVRVLPGARIGQEGFGFTQDGAGGYLSVPQLGRVILEDDVEIGANTTIDRGSTRDTVIGAGSRLDNLVMIGHNVQCGRGCVIVAQAGISGSTILGDHVQVGGQAGLTGHLQIGRQARIGAQAGVMADVAAGASIIGAPAQPARQFFLEYAALRRIAQLELDRGRGKRLPKPECSPDGDSAGS